MSPAKRSAEKNGKKTVEADEIVPPAKIKKDFDFEGHETADPAPEKTEDGEDFEDEAGETDDLSDEAGLDDEEIDPFNDKWEE